MDDVSPHRSNSSRVRVIKSRPEPSVEAYGENRCRPPSAGPPRLTYSFTGTQRVDHRPVSANRRPTPPPSSKDKSDRRAGSLASKLTTVSMLVFVALYSKLTCAWNSYYEFYLLESTSNVDSVHHRNNISTAPKENRL
jgi:hypothetical protein